MNSSQLAIHGGTPITSMPLLRFNIGEAESSAVKKMIDETGILSAFRGGDKVREFETAFAKYVGAKYAIATSSGTTALHASVAALELSPEDEVLVPAMTFVSTASVVLQEGARVVFVDVDEYFCMDPRDILAKITEHTKAIIPVHLYGQPADMNTINAIAKKHKLIVIEDACQSHGAQYDGEKTGTLGDIGCFSFFQSKNMTTGEGGMITTSNEELYRKLRLRREHGSPSDSSTWYNYQTLGYNYNMTEMQGTVGIVQLQKLDEMNQGRIDNALLYDDTLKGFGLELPKVRESIRHVRHNYPVLLPKNLTDKRDFFVEALKAEGIPVDVAYPKALYDTQLFIDQGITGNCPRTEDYVSRLFTLFTDTSITKTSIENTGKAIQKIMAYLKDTK
ncbi:MAG: DegT/DnrJ/EryC1/StrS family aminotransferase [Candidatus Microsaccharimonas sp.]